MAATSSGIIVASHKEEVFANPLYELIRMQYETQLKADMLANKSILIVLPCISVLEKLTRSVYSTKKFLESHILQSAHVPGLFCTVRGEALEIRGDRIMTTGRSLSTSILQTENIFDLGYSFKVVVVDKALSGDTERDYPEEYGNDSNSVPVVQSGGGPSEFLAHSAMIESDFFEKLKRLKNTYILCPGLESHFANRIKELCTQTANQLVRYLPAPVPSFQLVQADLERVAYATLHGHVFPHLGSAVGESDTYVRNLATKSMVRIEHVLRESQAPDEIVVNLKTIVPFIEGLIVPEMNRINEAITPQQKINYLVLVSEKLTSIFREVGIREASADHLLAGMLIAIICADLRKANIHVSHMAMFLSVHPELAIEKGSFASTTFQSCVEFLNRAILV
jgi:hypothetical protein